MGLQFRKKSKIIEKGKYRSNRLRNVAKKHPEVKKVIDPDDYDRLVQKSIDLMNAYNSSVIRTRALNDQFKTCEKELADCNERVLLGVKALYGRDSHQYGSMGGMRKSQIKGYRPVTFKPEKD